MEEGTAPEEAAKPPAKGGSVRETVKFLLLLFLFAVLLRSFLFAPFNIPSGSMLPRLMIGDYLFVAKWPYGYSRFSFPFGILGFDGRFFEGTPERGDIAVFRYPGGTGDDWVKRVIGLPGDTVQMSGGQLILNGEPVPKTRIADFLVPVTPNSPCHYVAAAAQRAARTEGGRRFCPYQRFRETLPNGRSYEVIDQIDGPADHTPVHEVPPGHYFVMGDNRDDSQDSRFPVEADGVGYLPAEYLIGRAQIGFFSTDGSAEWLKPWTWFSAARWERIGGTYR